MSRKVLLDSNDDSIRKYFYTILTDLGMEPCDEEDEFLNYCFVSPAIGFNYESCKLLELDKLEDIASNMRKKKQGKMIYITSSVINNVNIDNKYTKASAVEEYNLALFKSLAVNLANDNINCNIIEVGFNDLFDAKIKNSGEYVRRLLTRRMINRNDIVPSIKLLFSDASSYMVGSVIRLDGGLNFGVVTEKSKRVLEPVQSIEEPSLREENLTGKNVIVFGSSSGIGKAIAFSLSEKGANLILVARREDKLREIKDQIKGNCKIYSADVTDREKINEILDRVWEEENGIDAVVYSAGQGFLVSDFEFQNSYKKMNDINFEGYVNVCEKLVNQWKENKVNGRIVAVSTVDIERIPSIGLGCYSVTKAALTQYTKNLALAGAKYGIRANCVMPGYVETEMLEWTAESYRKRWIERIPLHRLGKSDDIAGVVSFLLGDESSYISGNNVLIDGGYMLNNVSDIV
jgi:3-oxoacyl-[acyl-carrier protein] reductase